MRAFTRPMIVHAMGQPEQACQALEPLPLRSRPANGDNVAGLESRVREFLYDEAWLQRLIHVHPALLPIEAIEPRLTEVVPICLELPVPSGYVDNLMLTPEGGIALVEAKLWRNPEARREVVGQVLDYAKDLSGFTYEDLQTRVRQARREPALRLYDVVHPDGQAEGEGVFIDAVSRNLRLGRFLALICGDGIQEGAEQLTDFLQRHIGLHFTLGLVEMSLWRDSFSGQILVQPRILARTVQIERAVVKLEEGIALHHAARVEPVSASSSRPETLSAETFYEQLAQVEPSLPAKLKAFLNGLEPLGVQGDMQRTLNLRWRSTEGRSFSLGMIDASGKLFTDTCHATPMSIGRIDLCHAYKRGLAAILPSGSVQPFSGPMGFKLTTSGQTPTLGQLLTDAGAWEQVIADYVGSLQHIDAIDDG
jgi:hypothetical protein